MTLLHRNLKITPAQERAAHWFVVMSSDDVSHEEQNGFKSWINESEENQRSYLKIQQVWQSFDVIEQSNKDTNRQILDQVLEGSSDTKKQPSFGRNSVISFCLLILCLLVGVDSNLYYQFNSDLSTFDGQLSSYTLKDGSKIVLDAGSAVDIEYSDTERRIFLYRGRVHAEVASNPNWPFIIETKSATATALGTAFSVTSEEDSTQLVVTESKVEFCLTDANKKRVNPHCVKAIEGKGSNILNGHLSQPKSINLLIETAWINDRIVVNNQPLISVLEQLSKYDSGLLIYNRHNLKNVNISGVFPTNDISTAITMLSQNSNLKIARLPGISIIINLK